MRTTTIDPPPRARAARLETLAGPTDHAIALYRQLGFQPARRFDETNLDDLLYFERPPGRAT